MYTLLHSLQRANEELQNMSQCFITAQTSIENNHNKQSTIENKYFWCIFIMSALDVLIRKLNFSKDKMQVPRGLHM